METPPHEEQAAQDDASQDGAQPIALLPESPQPEEERAQQETPQPERREAENTRAVIATPVSETARSVRTLDRSKWPRMVIGPADGATPHGPLLFEDVPVETETNQDDEPHYAELDLETVRLPAEDFSRVSENASVGQSQILEALGDGQAQNWSAQNGKHLLLQPLKVSLDLVTAPFHSINEANNQETETDTDTDSPSGLTKFFDGLFNKESREIHEDDSTPQDQSQTVPDNDTPDDTSNNTPQESASQDEPPTAGK